MGFAEYIISHESALRFGFFGAFLFLIAAWEVASPMRRSEVPQLLRWSNHVGMIIVDSFVLRLVFPLLGSSFALLLQNQNLGLFNVVALPSVVAFILTLLVFDFITYLKHRALHSIPLLWRAHRVHHTDVELDVTTALRFHPLEMIFTMVVKFIAIAIFGPSPEAFIAFEILLLITSLFNHGNIAIPQGFEKYLRLVLVTPDMHRVHHSTTPKETDTNYGFNFPWWDWLFHTYDPQIKTTKDNVNIGLKEFRPLRQQWLDKLLIQPFVKPNDKK